MAAISKRIPLDDSNFKKFLITLLKTIEREKKSNIQCIYLNIITKKLI
jgi:hypothetical protein